MAKSSRLLQYVLILALFTAGCSTPIGVRQLAPRDAYRNSMAGPLREGVANPATIVIINRHNLSKQMEKHAWSHLSGTNILSPV